MIQIREKSSESQHCLQGTCAYSSYKTDALLWTDFIWKRQLNISFFRYLVTLSQSNLNNVHYPSALIGFWKITFF